MESNFTLNVINHTSQGWHFVLYKNQPGKKIAWKILSLSKPQPYPTSATVSWNLTYEVIVPQHQEGNIYTGNVYMDAREGYSYKAVMEDGHIQIKEIGPGENGHIRFKNNTQVKPQDLGIRMGGSLISLQEQVVSGVTASFQLTSIYYLALFSHFNQHKEFEPATAAVETVAIEFPHGLNTVTVEAVLYDGNVTLTLVGYGYSSEDKL
jgi:hypothetical protein